MKRLFDLDSPIIQMLALFTNLVLLNLVWLLCCIPVFTIGAANTAMYYTVFQYQTNRTDSVLRPFFHSFRINFRQSTLLFLPVLALEILLLLSMTLLLTSIGPHFHPLWLLLGLLLLLLMVVNVFAFPLISRYESSTSVVLRNSIYLCLTNIPKFLLLAGLELLPWAIAVFLPNFFLRSLLFWACFAIAMLTYCKGYLLLGIFRHVQPEENCDNKEEIANK